VAIVGLGGTGSATAEQLVRLGVRDFLLVDPDVFEVSNITRMFGSQRTDAQSLPYKTEIVARNLRLIAPDAKVEQLHESIVSQRNLLRLRDRTVVFSCTDTDISRASLNRYAYQYLTPVIDMGMRMVVRDGGTTDAGGRVSLIVPGDGCLWCSHHLNSERIRVDSLPPDEVRRLRGEGYIEGAQSGVPSVISVNTTLASLAVTMFLSLLTGLSEVPRTATEQLYDVKDGTVFKSTPVPNTKCPVCGEGGVLGLGDTQPVVAYE
jgi:molybdopterin/thiamine biosynthesis adenylyltransferase